MRDTRSCGVCRVVNGGGGVGLRCVVSIVCAKNQCFRRRDMSVDTSSPPGIDYSAKSLSTVRCKTRRVVLLNNATEGFKHSYDCKK